MKFCSKTLVSVNSTNKQSSLIIGMLLIDGHLTTQYSYNYEKPYNKTV